MQKVSIIIPINNDLAHGKLREQVEVFQNVQDIEIIYVDGGSTDGSIEFLSRFKFSLVNFPNSNRAERIKKGDNE